MAFVFASRPCKSEAQPVGSGQYRSGGGEENGFAKRFDRTVEESVLINGEMAIWN
jgi:hypothetical protein